MIFTKYFDKKRAKEETLANVKQSTCSIGTWQKGTFVDRLVLLPQYFLAYTMFLSILFLRLFILKTYGVLFLIIFIIGLYGDGTTYIETICFLCSVGAFLIVITILPFFNSPKRLQWFYNVVGEKRGKPLLFDL